MQNSTAPKKGCPIQDKVYINKNQITLEDGKLNILDWKGRLKYQLEGLRMSFRLIFHPSESFNLSNPFIVRRGRDTGINQVFLIRKKFDDAFNRPVYEKIVPVRVGKKARNKPTQYFTHSNENNLMIAVTKKGSNRLAIFALGIVSQNNEFYFAKVEKYNVGMFMDNGSLVIPEMSELEGLVELVAPLVEDIKSLPAISTYQPQVISEPMLGPYDGEVLWHDPFSGQIALRTKIGTALCPIRNVVNLPDKVLVMKKWDMVKFRYLQEPDPDSNTSFEFIAGGVSV